MPLRILANRMYPSNLAAAMRPLEIGTAGLGALARSMRMLRILHFIFHRSDLLVALRVAVLFEVGSPQDDTAAQDATHRPAFRGVS